MSTRDVPRDPIARNETCALCGRPIPHRATIWCWWYPPYTGEHLRGLLHARCAADLLWGELREERSRGAA
jgi:hypothetical protein